MVLEPGIFYVSKKKQVLGKTTNPVSSDNFSG